MDATPAVSVVIPLYNLRAFVGETIESVLAQTLAPDAMEIVVIDDGSTDGGGEVVARYAPRVRCVRQENRGLSAARNAGVRATRAPFLTFLDADDRLLPEKLATQLDVFRDRPELGAVYGGWYYIDGAGARLPQRGRSAHAGDLLPALLLGNLMHPHTVLVRRDLVEAAGGFDETLTSLEDWDLWLRLARAGARWHYVDRPLAEYRLRPDAMHQDPGRMLENRLRVLARVFDDPDLPAALAARRPLAYQNAHLEAACAFLRAGDRLAAARCFHAAVVARPALVTEAPSLRRIGRLVLPEGYQQEAALARQWRPVARVLREVLADLFATPGLAPSIGGLRRRAALAYWRTVLRLARKGLLAALRGDPRPPLPASRAQPVLT
jgi:cellulose synthase/poly-beta-1,6-N-acetylglucosamine synthase-like glycosyltransferase